MYTMGIARTEKMRCLSGGRVDMDVSTVYFYKKRKWEKREQTLTLLSMCPLPAFLYTNTHTLLPLLLFGPFHFTRLAMTRLECPFARFARLRCARHRCRSVGCARMAKQEGDSVITGLAKLPFRLCMQPSVFGNDRREGESIVRTNASQTHSITTFPFFSIVNKCVTHRYRCDVN